MLLSFLGGNEQRACAQGMNCDILYQFIAVSLICHVTWARIETLLQGDYTREEVFNPVAYGNNFLGVCS